MKKIISIIIALSFIFTLAACGGNADETAADYRIAIVQQLDHSSLDEIREAVKAQLQERAAAEGINILIEEYSGQNDATVLNQRGSEIMGDGVDMIIPIATLAAQCMVTAADGSDVPVIYAAASDPVAAGLTDSIILCVCVLKHKRKGICHLLDALRGRFACTVSCVGVDADKHRVIALVAVLQLGCKLKRVCRHHTVVVVARSNECCRVLHALLQIVQWRVLYEVVELLLNIRRAILHNPAVADGKAMVAQHIQHTHSRQCNSVQVRALCHTRTHQQTSVRAACNRNAAFPICKLYFFRDQPFDQHDPPCREP